MLTQLADAWVVVLRVAGVCGQEVIRRCVLMHMTTH
jgi:hypothetical protein